MWAGGFGAGFSKVFEAALAHPLAEILFRFLMPNIPTNQSLQTQLRYTKPQYGIYQLPDGKYRYVCAVLNEQDYEKQRRADFHYSGFSPGCKVEAGENDVAAVKRGYREKVKNKEAQVDRRRAKNNINKNKKGA